MSVKYPNYVNLTSSSEEQPNERTPSPPPRKKSLSPPQAPSKSISSKSTHYTSSSSPSESPTPTHVAPPPKLCFVIPIKLEPQELPPTQMSPNDPYVQTMDNWPSGPSNPSPPPHVSRPPPGFPNPPPGFEQFPSTQPLFGVNHKMTNAVPAPPTDPPNTLDGSRVWEIWQHGQILKEKSNEAKVKHDIDEIETINIELEHSVAKLLAENEKNSSKNMPRFSSNDMVHNHYLEEARKKRQESGKNSRPSVIPFLDHKAQLMVANQNLGAILKHLGIGLHLRVVA
ncbi:hypothetical protein Tco_1483135 [Tanacetum coccineum]